MNPSGVAVDGMVVQAAGALPWRRRRGVLEVALVHRPRYGDWSWPKGKLDPGETWSAAAVREVFEETGLHVRLGRTLPTSVYTVADAAGQPTAKECRYWAAEVVGGDGTLVNEIDEVQWLDVPTASARLTYARDIDQLCALELADTTGTLTTWPLVIVRHAKALSRASWSPRADPLRPLNPRGRQRAQALIPILAAYGVTRILTSPSVRCVATIQPYSATAGARLRLKPGLSEEGFAEQPDRAGYHLTRLLERGNAAVLCSHGPVLPVLFELLAGIADTEDSGSERSEPNGAPTRRSADSAPKLALAEAADNGLGKGEAFVAHVVGTGEQARIVDIERHTAS